MPYRLYKIIFLLTVLAILVGLAIFCLAYNTPKNLEVDFLDVGQGDAALIKTPYGQNILVDGGPNGAVIKRLSENLPWWDRTIDLVILTHPHDDHVAGLNDVLDRYKVKRILATGVNHTGPAYIQFLEKIKNTKIPLAIIDRPQTIDLGADCRLKFLYPDSDLSGQEVEKLNNTSIVFKLEFKDNSFLFTGDIEIEAENEIVAYGQAIKAEVLKVTHHGSEHGSQEAFVNAVKPQFAIISAGKDNQFGHPNGRTLNRLERARAQILRTDESGTARLMSDGRDIWQAN